MNKTSKIAMFSAFLTTGVVSVLSIASVTNAQGFEALTSVPGLFEQGKATNPISILSGLYGLAMGIGAVIAVVMIIYAGFQYMYEESIFGKSEAKSKIINAFAGLALILGSYIILRTINTDLVNFNLALPGGTGKVSGLIASQAETDAINSALHAAATNSTQRIEEIATLKSSLTQDLSKLEVLKKQPQSAERDSQINTLQAQIDQEKNNISQKTISHLELTNKDIITVAKAKEFDREIEKLSALIVKGDDTQISVEARKSLNEISSDMARQLTILNNNMNTVANLETTGDTNISKETLIKKTGQDIAYLGTSKNMVDEMYKSIDTVGSGLANQTVKARSAEFDKIISVYAAKVVEFEGAGRKDLAENLKTDMNKATQLMKIRQTQNCAVQTPEVKQTLTLCKN